MTVNNGQEVGSICPPWVYQSLKHFDNGKLRIAGLYKLSSSFAFSFFDSCLFYQGLWITSQNDCFVSVVNSVYSYEAKTPLAFIYEL